MTMSNVTKAAIIGFAAGAIFSTIAGFTIGGWMTTSKAKTMAEVSSTKAVVAVLAPLCAKNFNAGNDRPARLAQLKEKSVWQRAEFIEQGGWAKIPGSEKISPGVAGSCAEMIVDTK